MTETPGPITDRAAPQAEQPAGVDRQHLRSSSGLRRSVTDRKVAGVAGGLGRHLDIDPIILRVRSWCCASSAAPGFVLYGAAGCWCPRRARADGTVAHQPGHPHRPADRRRRRRGAAAGRRLLGRRRVPVAAVPGRHRRGALPGAPGPAAARGGPAARCDVRRPGRCRPAAHRPDLRRPGRCRPAAHRPDLRRPDLRGPAPGRHAAVAAGAPAGLPAASSQARAAPVRDHPGAASRWPWARSVSTRRAAARSPTPPTPRSRSPWSA